MDPNANIPPPSFDVPRLPEAEAGQAVNPNLPLPEVNAQTELHNMELPAAQSPMPPPVSSPAPLPGAAGSGSAPAVSPPAPPSVVPVQDDDLSADDNDLIEKAWVQKAKAIVERTKDDPYLQNKEINKVKASYIKKRYNKDIKVSDEPAQ